MNLILRTTECRPDGIFSRLTDSLGSQIAVTLEHAYEQDGQFCAKIPAGEYECVRSKHRLHGMTEDFETFEVMGVEGHAGLLFHWGNLNADSEGCILTGEKIADFDDAQGVTNSRTTFAHFMKLQTGVDKFILTVLDR